MEIIQVQHTSTTSSKSGNIMVGSSDSFSTFQQGKVLGSPSKDDTSFGYGPPGLSPMSPRCVTMLKESAFDMDGSTFPPSLPTPKKNKIFQGIVNAASTKEEKESSPSPHDPYHGRYLLTPSRHVLEPILRTVLEASNRAGEIDIARMIIDDVLEHQLFMSKSGDHVFSCTFGSGAGPRIVMARHHKMFPSASSSSRDSAAGSGGMLEFEQQFDIYCSEKAPVDSFLRYLQTYDVEIEDESLDPSS